MLKKILPFIIPYITVATGLLLLKNAWIAQIGYHLGILAVITIWKKPLAVSNLFRTNNLRIPVIMSTIGISSGLFLYLLWPLFSVNSEIGYYLQKIGLNAETWPYYLAYFILVNPLIEEYYWRGYLGSETRMIYWSDVFFAGYHVLVLGGEVGFVWLVIIFLAMLAGAWIWRQSNRLSNGLLPSVASHLAADLTIILTIYWMAMR